MEAIQYCSDLSYARTEHFTPNKIDGYFKCRADAINNSLRSANRGFRESFSPVGCVMGLAVFYRSIEPMHPALSYESRRRVEELVMPFSWILCDPPEFDHNSDGHLSGVVEPFFADESTELLNDLTDSGEGCLMVVIKILAELSRELAVDWEFSHDYEPDVIGRIVEGNLEPSLMEELEAVISIGGLFGEFGEDEEEDVWEVELREAPAWNYETTITKPTLMAEYDEPRVLKFPGVE